MRRANTAWSGRLCVQDPWFLFTLLILTNSILIMLGQVTSKQYGMYKHFKYFRLLNQSMFTMEINNH